MIDQEAVHEFQKVIVRYKTVTIDELEHYFSISIIINGRSDMRDIMLSVHQLGEYPQALGGLMTIEPLFCLRSLGRPFIPGLPVLCNYCPWTEIVLHAGKNLYCPERVCLMPLEKDVLLEDIISPHTGAMIRARYYYQLAGHRKSSLLFLPRALEINGNQILGITYRDYNAEELLKDLRIRAKLMEELLYKATTSRRREVKKIPTIGEEQ